MATGPVLRRLMALGDQTSHLLFILLHFIAFTISQSFLVITIPAHVIYMVVSFIRGRRAVPNPSTHVRCPNCHDLVLKEATACEHCNCKLIPQR